MNITMHKGDTCYRSFSIKNKNGDINTDNFDEIYFTVKRNANNSNFLFQKRLSAGGITKDENGTYHFIILPENTDDLYADNYNFDIELVKKEPVFKQTILGTLDLLDEITTVNDEV